ncbi:MAG: ATP-binding protein [Deltaproteobacteria bacterium]|nr:ATP-binding protein [Deltaproteobacteria bacterium]
MRGFFERSELLNVLHGFNPWWAGKPCAVPSFRRLAFDTCLTFLKDLSLRRAILLSGPRRVGKTTILSQIANHLTADGIDPKAVLYISLDHPLVKLLNIREILEVYHESIHPQGQPGFLLLDEIQYSKEWATEIKLLIDHQPGYRILATGSASVVQKERLAESGVGRWITVPIPTLSFFEFVHIRGDRPPDIPANLRPSDLFGKKEGELAEIAVRCRELLPAFQQYLLVGGFPETAIQKNISLCQRLLREDVVERVLNRDMTALFGVRNINDLEKLFIYLCLHSGGIIAHKTCAISLETSTATVANHLGLLEQANLIYRLPPAEVSGKRILKARNKYYLVDAALRNAVLLRGEEILTHTDEMGAIVETTVLRHLYAYYYRDTPEIAYWRDPISQKEVDVIIRSPKYILPFEIKYQENPNLRETSGLVAYCRLERIKQAYWVVKLDRDFGVAEFDGLETRFLKIPAHILCYLLGQSERLLWG